MATLRNKMVNFGKQNGGFEKQNGGFWETKWRL